MFKCSDALDLALDSYVGKLNIVHHNVKSICNEIDSIVQMCDADTIDVCVFDDDTANRQRITFGIECHKFDTDKDLSPELISSIIAIRIMIVGSNTLRVEFTI